ncbi:MAG: exopolyphosphatase [Robiginitomaculum sp.]|nr:MAG: exopolyphosphatase [Robiginitomaculum sp.]
MPDNINAGSLDDSENGAPKRRRRRGKNQGSRRGSGRNNSNYFGVIDLGTNNCRLLIARSRPNGFQVVDSYSNVVRLGAGLATTGRLSEESMDAAVKAIAVCAHKMKAKSVKRWRCIATQACRAASNGEEFMARVKRETGLTFETISPRVEARLSVMGCVNIIDHNKDVALVIDIGGGSTELSWVDVRRLKSESGARLHRPPISAWASLPIGVVNLSELYPENPDDLAGWYDEMKACVLKHIQEQGCEKRFVNTFKEGRGHLVGTSGTITSLASVYLKLPYYQRNKIDGIWMETDNLINTARHLSSISLSERQKEPCIGEDRATMLVAGCAIVDVITELWPTEKTRVADRGLREGMLMGLMNKTQIGHKQKNTVTEGKAIVEANIDPIAIDPNQEISP